jgi:TolA-binding protein
MEKLARIFFVFTLLFAAAFIIFFLLYAQAKNEVTQSKVDRAGLQQSLSTLENTANKQEILYEELQRKYDLLTEEASEKSDLNVQKLKDQIYDQQKQIEDQHTQLSENDQKIETLKVELESKPVQDTINASVINLNPSNNQLAEVSAEYEKEIKKLQSEINRLSDELESSSDGDQRLKDLQERVGQTQQSLDKAIDQVKKLEDQLNNKTAEIEKLTEQLSNAANSTKIIAEKQSEIEKLNQQIALLNDSIANEKEAVTSKVAEIESLNKELNAKRTEIKILEASLEREKKYDPIPSGEADAVRYKYLLLGEDALSAGNDIQSAEYFQRARLNDLALGDLHKVYERKRELAYQKAIAVHYNNGYQLYKDKNYNEAIDDFSSAVELARDVKTDYLDDSLYYRALSEYNFSDYSAAETDFDEIIATQKDSNYVPHSLYYLCKILESQGRKDKLKTAATELAKYTSYSDYANKILKSLN